MSWAEDEGYDAYDEEDWAHLRPIYKSNDDNEEDED